MNRIGIGFLAKDGDDYLSGNGALLVIHQKTMMKNIIREQCPGAQLVKLSLWDLIEAMETGESFSLDEPAYDFFEQFVELYLYRVSVHTQDNGSEYYIVSRGSSLVYSF